MADLEADGLLCGLEHFTAEELWPFYRKQPEFVKEKVMFSQFAERLADHRKQAERTKDLARRDSRDVQRDRSLYPRKTHNQRGELVWDIHPAKKKLRKDVKRGKHLKMTPSELRQTRPEYRLFRKSIFRQRIYQEVRLQKFINWLELDRVMKKKAGTKAREQEASRDPKLGRARRHHRRST